MNIQILGIASDIAGGRLGQARGVEILCDYVRDQFNAQEDFSLTFPEFCNMYIDNDDLIYYTTYCMDTGEYYLVTRDDITGELNYILTAVDPIEIASL